MNRTKALKLNTAASLISELITLITGLILPRLVLLYFGSSSNGLVSSISQFLGFSAVLRAGLGGAIRAALYKPLAESDDLTLSGIMTATQRYMRKIGTILGIGIISFAFIYPVLVQDEYDWFFSFSMVLIIGVGVFADNFFGIKYKILLQADQKYYVQIGVSTLSNLISSVISILLIVSGQTIQIVKLCSAASVVISPIALSLYVKKHYNINWKEKPNEIVIKNRWNAFFQQIAIIVNDNIDLTLLTILVSLREVSVYTVHFMVVNNIGKVVNSFVSGINSTFGDMIAKRENVNLQKRFLTIEWTLMAISVVFYSVTMVMLPSFLALYTKSVDDVNYIRPFFAGLMVITTLVKTSRIPYQMLSEGAGRFKETRNGAILEVVINLFLSIVLTIKMGIEGVLLATLVAGSIRTIEYAIFCFKNILNMNLSHIIKHYTIMGITFIFCVVVGNFCLGADILNYWLWAANAVLVMVISAVIVGVISILFYRDQMQDMLSRLLHR